MARERQSLLEINIKLPPLVTLSSLFLKAWHREEGVRGKMLAGRCATEQEGQWSEGVSRPPAGGLRTFSGVERSWNDPSYRNDTPPREKTALLLFSFLHKEERKGKAGKKKRLHCSLPELIM